MLKDEFFDRLAAGMKSGTVINTEGYVMPGYGFVITKMPDHRVVVTMFKEKADIETITIKEDGIFHKWLLEIITHVGRKFDFDMEQG